MEKHVNETVNNEMLSKTVDAVQREYSLEILSLLLYHKHFSDGQKGLERKKNWEKIKLNSPYESKVVHLRNALSIASLCNLKPHFISEYGLFLNIKDLTSRLLLVDIFIARMAQNKDPLYTYAGNDGGIAQLINDRQFNVDKVRAEENAMKNQMFPYHQNELYSPLPEILPKRIILKVLSGTLKLNNNPEARDSFEEYREIRWPNDLK